MELSEGVVYSYKNKHLFKAYPEIHIDDVAIIGGERYETVTLVPGHAAQHAALVQYPKKCRWTVLLLSFANSTVLHKQTGISNNAATARQHAIEWWRLNMELALKSREEIQEAIQDSSDNTDLKKAIQISEHYDNQRGLT